MQYYTPTPLIIDGEKYVTRLQAAVDRAKAQLEPEPTIIQYALRGAYEAGYKDAMNDVMTFRDSLMKPAPEKPEPA